MASSKPDVFEVVHEAFDLDTSHTLARATVDAVLDLHYAYKNHCVECSRGIATSTWPLGAVKFPCRTVQAILKVAKKEA